MVTDILIKDKLAGFDAVHDLLIQHPDPFADDFGAVLDALIIR